MRGLLVFLIAVWLSTSGCMTHRVAAVRPPARKSSYTKTSPAQMTPYIRTVFRVSAENRWKTPDQPQTGYGLAETDSLEATQRSAQDLEKKGFHLKAVRLYEDLLFRSPQNPAWDLALARIWIKLGNKPQALTHARQAFAKDGGTLESLRTLGSAYILQGSPAKAIVPLHQALQMAPHDIALLRDLATAHMQLEEWQSARGYLEQLLASDGSRRLERRQLAMVLTRLQETGLALKELLRIHEPAEAYQLLGTFCLQQEKWRLARASYQQALALRPGLIQAREGLAEAESYIPFPTIITLPERWEEHAAAYASGDRGANRAERSVQAGEASAKTSNAPKGRTLGGGRVEPEPAEPASSAPSQERHEERQESAQASDWEKGELTTLSIGANQLNNVFAFIEE